MAIAIDPNQLQPYVCEPDRELPESEQTTFMLRPLATQDHSAVFPIVVRLQKKDTMEPRDIMDLLLLGLAGWSNLRDADGEEIEFETGSNLVQITGKRRSTVKLSLLDCIPAGFRLEIAMQVLNSTTAGLTEEDRGKS